MIFIILFIDFLFYFYNFLHFLIILHLQCHKNHTSAPPQTADFCGFLANTAAIYTHNSIKSAKYRMLLCAFDMAAQIDI